MANTHLNGSVPLDSTEEVFRAVMRHCGDGIRRLPDGETGERGNWISFQFIRLAEQDGIDMEWGSLKEATNPTYHHYPRLTFSKPIGEVVMPDLGYSGPALESYNVFSKLKADGEIPNSIRFMLALPTPFGFVIAACYPDAQLEFEPIYKSALMAEFDRVCSQVPHEQLAVQWDIPCEVMAIEGEATTAFPSDDLFDEIISRVVEAGNSIPSAAELGFHFCYGDYMHEPFKEPEDLGVVVRIANAVMDRLDRRTDFIHVPVPGMSNNPSFYEPLRDLNLGETELYIGLIHPDGGLEGAQDRIAAARQALPKDMKFGVGTQCGMGRFAKEEVDDLLRMHSEASTE